MNNQTKWYDPIMLGAIAGSGMFKVKFYIEKYGDKKFIEKTETFTSIEGTEVRTSRSAGLHISDCTLIARSIDDMTEEEGVRLVNLLNKNERIISCQFDGQVIDYKVESGIGVINIKNPTNPTVFLYLLSIGVWAGDWHRVVKG
ncbi:MAG: hypothetical protein RIE52_11990 [Balneola sp.]